MNMIPNSHRFLYLGKFTLNFVLTQIIISQLFMFITALHVELLKHIPYEIRVVKKQNKTKKTKTKQNNKCGVTHMIFNAVLSPTIKLFTDILARICHFSR